MGIDEDPEDSAESIYLNICGAMEPIKQIDCPPGAAVCRWVRGAGTRPMSIGDYDPTAEWEWEEDENPTIVYKSKTSCGNGNFYKTKIELTCDPNRKKDYPRLVAVDEDTCTFLITIEQWVANPVLFHMLIVQKYTSSNKSIISINMIQTTLQDVGLINQKNKAQIQIKQAICHGKNSHNRCQ